MKERLKRRGTWSLGAGFGSVPLIDQLVPLEVLLREHGWKGLLIIAVPILAGVAVFAVEKRGDINNDGKINALDLGAAFELAVTKLREDADDQFVPRPDGDYDNLNRLIDAQVKPVVEHAQRVIDRFDAMSNPARRDTTQEIPTIPASNFDPPDIPYDPPRLKNVSDTPIVVAVPDPEPAFAPAAGMNYLPIWQPTAQRWVKNDVIDCARLENGHPAAGRPRREHEGSRPGALLHTTGSPAETGFYGYERWALSQTEKYSGYHIVCALDIDEPMLLADAEMFKMFHGREWNEMWGIALVCREANFAALPAADQRKLAMQAAMALRYIKCESPGYHPVNGRIVSDSNKLTALPDDVEYPNKNSHVAHDWCVSDRDRNGRITKSDDWKSDPGEAAMDLVRDMLKLPTEKPVVL